MSYAVTQGRRGIGVRIALGAQRGDVLRMVIWEGSLLAFGAIALGIGGALGLTRPRASLLYCGVSPTDPLAFAAVAIILLAVALLGFLIPARRAMRVDPIVALRYE
jgi:putative ABC transport system permease protein